MGRKWIAWLLVGVLLGAFVPAEATSAQTAGGGKVIVENSEVAAIQRLTQSGATRLVDYGSFSLWRANTPAQRAAAAPVSGAGGKQTAPRTDLDTIRLRDRTVTTTGGTNSAPRVSAALTQNKASGKQLWLVQFVGPVLPKWLDNLKAMGIEIVAYIPYNAYVIYLDGGQLAKLESATQSDPTIQFTGAYHPEYRLAPPLKNSKTLKSPTVPVTVQFYKTANTTAALAKLRALGSTVHRAPAQVLAFVNISLDVPVASLAQIAAEPDVFNVEPYTAPTKKDEGQAQILAGNITTSGGNVTPSGPGYLAWLQSKGFPTDPTQYPIVAVVDDGVDTGTTTPLHPDFYQNGATAQPSRIAFVINCTADPAADGQAGHGNINAGILGGYNDKTGTAYTDASGYHYGLGISPYNRLGNVKIFQNAGPFDETGCGAATTNDTGYPGTIQRIYDAAAGAPVITSNSWGSSDFGVYSADSQAYDALTRDGSGTTGGNQEILHVFAASNDGPGAGSVGSPGTAKNVLTVGATQSTPILPATSGCASAGANNADIIADFSSRGPTSDGRAKPDIVAPGVHIEGPASQDPTYTGAVVSCKYYPDNQTLYARSNGTSHATPAVAGVASLVSTYYQRHLDGTVGSPGPAPTPAMIKAYMLNAPRYLTSAGGTLPSADQGWGDADMGLLFDGTPRVVHDEDRTFNATGETKTYTGVVQDTSKPFHVTLAFTDAPGSTTADAFVNDLDLEVTIGGQTYKGNVFSGANSTIGGAADGKNNVESVFLPAGVSGPFAVRVKASNIAQDAVTAVAGGHKQDYALVVYNGNEVNGPVPYAASTSIDDSAGNNNGVVEPGETIHLTLALGNVGTATATGVHATLATSAGGVQVTQNNATYADIAVNSTQSNSTPLTFTVDSTYLCSTPINFTATVTYSGGSVTIPLRIAVGTPTLTPVMNYASSDVPKAIPDKANDSSSTPPGSVTSNLPIAVSGTVSKIKVHVAISHTWDGDLALTLISPANTSVLLKHNTGDSGANFVGTIFDDDATMDIGSASAPFTGSFRPENALSTFSGDPINGTWKLNITDNAHGDSGTLTGWSLDFQSPTSVCAPAGAPTIAAISQTAAPTTGGATVLITGTNFAPDATVTFGTTAATTVTYLGSTKLSVVTPPHGAGTVDVTVTNPSVSTPALRSVTKTNAFSFGTVNAAPTQSPPSASPSPGVATPGGAARPAGPTPVVGMPTPNPLPPRR